MKDGVSSTDHVEAGVATQVVPPEYPCPIPGCGKPMKDNSSDESKEAGRQPRICSNRNCRARADWASGTPVLES